MKRTILILVTTTLLFAAFWFGLMETKGEWAGVDETVVEHYAEIAGRPPRDPYINTDQGDLLLLVFLLAGTLGGFVAGYSYRVLSLESSRSTGS